MKSLEARKELEPFLKQDLKDILEDWVSNTVSEADTFGTLTLYPAYRSFPEVFANNGNHLYVPWSLQDAIEKLQKMTSAIDNEDVSQYNIGKISDYQDGTIDRTLDAMLGTGEQLSRNDNLFRRHVARAKYE